VCRKVHSSIDLDNSECELEGNATSTRGVRARASRRGEESVETYSWTETATSLAGFDFVRVFRMIERMKFEEVYMSLPTCRLGIRVVRLQRWLKQGKREANSQDGTNLDTNRI